MPQPLAESQRELVKALWIQGVRDDRIFEQTGVKPGTLKTWKRRYNWPSLRNAVKQDVNLACIQVVRSGLDDASEALRREMSTLLAHHTGALSKVPAKANLAHIQKVGAALEPLVRSAKVVHDWGNQDVSGIVSIQEMKELKQATVDVQAEVQPALEAGTAEPSCVSDTPTPAPEIISNVQPIEPPAP